MPVSIVQEVRDGTVRNKLIVGDTMGTDVVRITPASVDQQTFAEDDTRITAYQLETQRLFFDEKKEQVQQQLFDFLTAQVNL